MRAGRLAMMANLDLPGSARQDGPSGEPGAAGPFRTRTRKSPLSWTQKARGWLPQAQLAKCSPVSAILRTRKRPKLGGANCGFSGGSAISRGARTTESQMGDIGLDRNRAVLTASAITLWPVANGLEMDR